MRCPVHPRMRGEHFQDKRVEAQARGSSPHARGTHWSVDLVLWTLRFIPACAGNTFSRGAVVGVPPVHPRMRGEHKI